MWLNLNWAKKSSLKTANSWNSYWSKRVKLWEIDYPFDWFLIKMDKWILTDLRILLYWSKKLPITLSSFWRVMKGDISWRLISMCFYWPESAYTICAFWKDNVSGRFLSLTWDEDETSHRIGSVTRRIIRIVLSTKLRFFGIVSDYN